MKSMKKFIALVLFAGFVGPVTLPQPAFAQYSSPVTVAVNGQIVNFDQPPVERAGRVFVPLRGVFEQLGASVVYADGQINATGNGRNISLHIGSTQATVNGQPQYLDVAPFLVGSRTLVPLRFIAQALGAAVDYQQGSNSVNITGQGTTQSSYTGYPGQQRSQINTSFSLMNERPVNVAQGRQSGIRANFSEPVQANTVRVRVDGTDVTNNTQVISNGFNSISMQLPSGAHRVRVTGTTQAGARFSTGWTFTAI
jgi:hypothetical protein